MAKLGRSENYLNSATPDMVPQSPEASMKNHRKGVRSRRQSSNSMYAATDISPNSTWGYSRRRPPSLASAYSTPSLNRLNSVGSKGKRPSSSNSNEVYGGQQDNTVYTRFSLPSKDITERDEQEVQRYLDAYACGPLPKIPKDYVDDFPQGLAKGKAVFVDAIADHISAQTGSSPPTALTQGDSKKGGDQQHAIMELVQTEANYIKVLEMMIDVHIAVFLELNKPLTRNGRPTRTSHHQHRRRRDSILEKLKSHHHRTGSRTENSLSSRASTSDLFNGPSSDTCSFQNFGSINSLLSTSETHGPKMIPDVRDIFGNLGRIYRANVNFWEDCFKPCFSSKFSSTQTNFTVAKLKTAFMKFETYFKPYAEYLSDCHSIVCYVKALEARNRLFATYSEWTTYHNTLNIRESLTSLLRKPFQRLLQYTLLLRRIKDETPDAEEIEDLNEMLSVVNKFVKEVESMIPEHEAKVEFEKFLKRIERYSYLKGPPGLLHPYTDGLAELKERLRQPITVGGKTKYRKLLAELPAKVKFRNGKIKEVICVLLTDQILICKEIHFSNSLDVYRPPISLSRAQLRQNNGILAIIEKEEPEEEPKMNLIREVYIIIVDGKAWKTWSEKFTYAKKALQIRPSLTQSSSWSANETRTTKPSIKSSAHKEAGTYRVRTLPPSIGRFGSSELLPPALVKRPTVQLLPEQPNPSRLSSNDRSQMTSRSADYQRRFFSRTSSSSSSSIGSISDSTEGQATSGSSSGNNSLRSNGPNRSHREERDEVDGLRRCDFPTKPVAVNATTARNRKRKGLTRVV